MQHDSNTSNKISTHFNDPDNWKMNERGDIWTYIPAIKSINERFAVKNMLDFLRRRNVRSPTKFSKQLENTHSYEDKMKVIREYRNLVLLLFYMKMEERYENFITMNIYDKDKME